MTALTLAALARAAANAQAIASACNPALAAARDKYVLASASDGQGGVTKPAVKYWLHFTLFGRGISPVRTVHGGSSPAVLRGENAHWPAWGGDQVCGNG